MATFEVVKTAIIEDFVNEFLKPANTFQNGTPIGQALEGVQTTIQGGEAKGTSDPGVAPVVIYSDDSAVQTD